MEDREMGISSEPKATQSVCVSQEILQSLDKCITLSRTLESLSFRVHLGEPAKEISKVEDKPAPNCFSYTATEKISTIYETLTNAIRNLEEFVVLK